MNSFLQWFKSSASPKKRKHDLQMVSREPVSVFLKAGEVKTWDPVGRVEKAIYRRRQVRSRIVNAVAALLSIIVNYRAALYDISDGMTSCRLLSCRFSAGEPPFPTLPVPIPFFAPWGAHSCLYVDLAESLFLPFLVAL